MVYLQAATNATGPAGKCVELAELGHVALYFSNRVLAEVRDVLARPKTLKRFPRLTAEAVDAFLKRATRFGTAVHDAPPRVALPRDPKDEKYINLALAASAELLVSRDNDLLDLMADEAFRAAHPALKVVDPVTLLNILVHDATNA
jgi:putative PIN family toxin of toxin-antitoxin system